MQKIRMAALAKQFQVNPATIYRWIKTQGFPKPIKLSPNCSAWNVAEVEAWEKTRERGVTEGAA
ncbi:helix-turn-helix transcriptional regulator [Thiomicrorhabdus cannonii]|uniref:helix-turn-helix transcriptional regulator n=1 Tax=Thiomicrorhabdus cannonii TaxID=2748011 RepID=UPI0015BBCBE8|nr:AlpA family phage regulatory protein [Thiomicrorhabdus cannonii]